MQFIETVAAQSADCMACSLQTARGLQIAWNNYVRVCMRTYMCVCVCVCVYACVRVCVGNPRKLVLGTLLIFKGF